MDKENKKWINASKNLSRITILPIFMSVLVLATQQLPVRGIIILSVLLCYTIFAQWSINKRKPWATKIFYTLFITNFFAGGLGGITSLYMLYYRKKMIKILKTAIPASEINSSKTIDYRLIS